MAGTMTRRKKWILIVLLALLLSGGVWGFRHWRRLRQPNVLFITLDTTRADRIGCYGYKLAKTPCLDELAANGVRFEQALTHVPLTLPSHATMLSGLLPPEHGLRVNAIGRLPESIETIPQRFQAKDYRTGAFLAAYVLDHKFGLERGFDVYDDNLSGGGAVSSASFERRRDGKFVVNSALEWLKSDSKKWFWQRKPSFCWVHLYDPHHPFMHTAESSKEFAGRQYDAEINYVDTQIKRLIDLLREQNELENTLIVVVGDHGEGLGDHNEESHGKQLYQSTLHVPLIWHWPKRLGTTPARRVAETVGLVDLAPTFQELFDLEPLPKTGGRSLVSALRGGSVESLAHYSETLEPYFEFHVAPQRGLVKDGWKYIQTPQQELYNLKEDPHELKNLFGAETERAKSYETLLSEREARFVTIQADAAKLDAAAKNVLDDLGYTTKLKEVPKDEVFKKMSIDVKQVLPAFNRATEAIRLRDSERKEVEAEKELAEISAKYPHFHPARMLYAETLARRAAGTTNDRAARKATFEKAIEVSKKLIDDEKDYADTEQTWEAHLILAGSLSEIGRQADADAAYEVAGKTFAQNAKVQEQIGMVYRDRWRQDQDPEKLKKSVTHLELATGIDPQLHELQFILGGFREADQKLEDAVKRYREVVKYAPGNRDAYAALARCQMRLGENVNAIATLEAGLKVFPKDPILSQMLLTFKSMK